MGPESSDLLSLLNLVARSMESVVPGLELRARICEPMRLEDHGVWVPMLGFDMRYQGVQLGEFQHGSTGSALEQVQAAALELMSQVQDVVAETTTEPWPLVGVDNRRDMALPDAVIEGDVLHMWYGDRAAPALALPSVHLAW